MLMTVASRDSYRKSPDCSRLRRFRFAPGLLLDLPVREQILVAAPGALPGTLHGICTALMEHFDDEVAMQAHRRVAVNPLRLDQRRLERRRFLQGHFGRRDLDRRSVVAVFVSGFTATLIAVLAGDLSVVLAASFGAAPRPILVTFLDEATAFLETAAVDFRVSFPFVLFKDIIPSDSGGVFSWSPGTLLTFRR